MSSIAFIGLGKMGAPMSANLLRAGHQVHGFDLVPEACQEAAAQGVTIAGSAAAAVAAAEIVFTMLPTAKHVLAVYPELLTAARPGTLFLDSSTIDVDSARQAHKLAEAAGMQPLDAPVSGGMIGAQNATLTFMLGGQAAAVERARPILAAVGKNVVHCGGPGNGQAAKICNNMVLGISMIATCEAFLLAEKLGLSDQAFYDVASTSSAQCWALTTNCAVPGPLPTAPANRDYAAGFATSLMLKDLRLARDAGQSTGTPLALGDAAAALFAQSESAGNGPKDFSAIIHYLRANAGGLE